jgi:PAS domain S-box-containing protein
MMMAPKKSKTLSKKGKITSVGGAEPNRVENALRESEEKFRTIFNNASDAFFFIDSEGRIIDVNRGACELTGYDYDELVKMKPHDFSGPDSVPLIPENIREVQEKGSILFETQITPKTGEQVPVEISARLIEYRGKKAFLAIVRNTTERKKAETARLLHEKAMASSPSGIVITDLKGKITYSNDAFLDIIGQKAEGELLGGNALDLIGYEDVGPQIFEEIIENGHYSGEYSRYRSDGNLIDVHITATLINDETGIPSHLMATITDITKVKEAEAEYRSLFESVPVGLYRTTPDGTILDVNPTLVNMLGYPDKDSLLTKNSSTFYVDPNARSEFTCGVIQEGIIRGFETQFQRLDGRIIWVLLNSRSIRNSKGKVIYYEGTIEDITDRKHALEALAASEERYRLFFEKLTDVILYIDSSLNIVDVSPSVEKHLGYHPDEIKDKFFPGLNLMESESLPQALENAKRLFEGKHVPPAEYAFIAKDGSRKWGEVSSTPITRDGQVVALFTLVRDIHDRKLAEMELKNTNRDLELYASLLRHDLGNDLQVIFSTTEIAQMVTPEDSELYEFLMATRASAERMTRLLDVFSRPEKEAEKEIVAIIERVADQANAAQKQLKINVKVPQKFRRIRVTGGRLLPMVFDNIFRNAAQHAGAKPIVDVSITRENNHVTVDIVDNGPGIPKKLLPKLFERGAATTESGLGLNLSKRVLEAYGGSIELLESPPTKGAAFRIVLPLEET